MKRMSVKVWAIATVALIVTCARADEASAVRAVIANSSQRCEEIKREKAELERQGTQSQLANPQITKTIAELDKVLTETTALLQDLAIATNGEKQREIAAHLLSRIVEGNALVLLAHSQLGEAPKSTIERVVLLNIEPFLAKGVDNPFFGIGGNNSEPVVVAAYKGTTPTSAEEIVSHYGSVPGGVVLEGAAAGLGHVSAVTYHGGYGALVMDGRLVYFTRVPPWEAAALCRAISRNKNMVVGVSMGRTNLVLGERTTYENTDVARDLMMTDHFLAHFIFGWNNWTTGYKFPNGYEPRTADVTSDMLVRFAFKHLHFEVKSGELQLAKLAVDVTMMPVSQQRTADGGMLPDMEALKRRYAPPPEFLANAQYFTSHFPFFRQERIVGKTLAYGALAALFRSFKRAGIDLEALASELERG